MYKRYVKLKLLITIVACLVGIPYGQSQDKQNSESQQQKSDSQFDSTLAKRLGADEYGMRKYVFAFLKRGPNRTQDSATAAQIQRGHLENIGRLAEEGKLSLAGPFLDDGEYRGIFIFNVGSVEEARKLTETDPAIQAGRLAVELHPWYGSAAVMEINAIHNRISRNEP